MRKIRSDLMCCYGNINEKQYLHYYPNRGEVTGRSAISGALLRQISQRGYFCSACEGLTDPETHQSSTLPSSLFLSLTLTAYHFCKDVVLYCRQMLTQDCGNWQELPMVMVKSGDFSQGSSF